MSSDKIIGAGTDFANADNFRATMVSYIKEHFADNLGEDVKLLDTDQGLELLQAKLWGNYEAETPVLKRAA